MPPGTVEVNEAIGGFRPLQGYERAVLGVEGDKPANELLALFFQYSYGHFDTGISHLLDASSRNHRERVHAAYHNFGYTFIYNKVGTRRGFAIM